MSRPKFTHMLTLTGGMNESMDWIEDMALDTSASSRRTISHRTVDSAQQVLSCLSGIGKGAQLLMVTPYGTAPLSGGREDSDFTDKDLEQHWRHLTGERVDRLTYAGLLGYTISRVFQIVPDTRVLMSPHHTDFNRWKDRITGSIPSDYLPRVYVTDFDYDNFRPVLESWPQT